MQQKINLNAEQILDKRFNIDFKGYAGQEVDEFLDLIVQDYDVFNHTIQELGKILSEYEEEIELLKQENLRLKNQSSAPAVEITSQNQLDVLKRIARLESVVFKK